MNIYKVHDHTHMHRNTSLAEEAAEAGAIHRHLPQHSKRDPDGLKSVVPIGKKTTRLGWSVP